ncbi:MAG TPA: hypothetical protein VFV95_13800 [Vicinamibacterales bacterium]|nr:hypothetical protein [Vicinamibacterales bacterium]
MTRQLLSAGIVAASVVAAMTVQPEAGQTRSPAARAASTAKPYVAPRTPWGDPDLQGGFSNVDENGIPFERPGNLAGKQLEQFDDSELAELAQARDVGRLEQARGIGGRDTGAGPVHWYEHYGAKNSRAWMVSDPADGLIPAQTAAAQQRLGRGGRGAGGGGRGGERADSYTDRSFYDRCITRGLPGSMMPAIYGNAYDITQSPGFVAIRYEMIHETRVIPLNNSRRSGLRSHMGDARGRWEGDTLVVETTNFDPRTVYRNASPKLVLTERFKPISPDKIDWSMTVNDPDTWVRPWTFGMTLTRDPHQPLVEYACHEGNYAMRNILSAARAQEAAAAKESK